MKNPLGSSEEKTMRRKCEDCGHEEHNGECLAPLKSAKGKSFCRCSGEDSFDDDDDYR